MASWTSQSTSSLLPGEPWTSAKALAAFENPEALAEGASGAPRIKTSALRGDNQGIREEFYFPDSSNRASPVVDTVDTRLGIIQIYIASSHTHGSGDSTGTMYFQGSNDNANWTSFSSQAFAGTGAFTKTVILNQPDDGDTVYRYYRAFASGTSNVSHDGAIVVTPIGGRIP